MFDRPIKYADLNHVVYEEFEARLKDDDRDGIDVAKILPESYAAQQNENAYGGIGSLIGDFISGKKWYEKMLENPANRPDILHIDFNDREDINFFFVKNGLTQLAYKIHDIKVCKEALFPPEKLGNIAAAAIKARQKNKEDDGVKMNIPELNAWCLMKLLESILLHMPKFADEHSAIDYDQMKNPVYKNYMPVAVWYLQQLLFRGVTVEQLKTLIYMNNLSDWQTLRTLAFDDQACFKKLTKMTEKLFNLATQINDRMRKEGTFYVAYDHFALDLRKAEIEAEEKINQQKIAALAARNVSEVNLSLLTNRPPVDNTDLLSTPPETRQVPAPIKGQRARLLQELHAYIGGNASNSVECWFVRVFTGHWNRHHLDAVRATLVDYNKIASQPNKEPMSVIEILSTLKTHVKNSNKVIKENGTLGKLLRQFDKDADYMIREHNAKVNPVRLTRNYSN